MTEAGDAPTACAVLAAAEPAAFAAAVAVLVVGVLAAFALAACERASAPADAIALAASAQAESVPDSLDFAYMAARHVGHAPSAFAGVGPLHMARTFPRTIHLGGSCTPCIQRMYGVANGGQSASAWTWNCAKLLIAKIVSDGWNLQAESRGYPHRQLPARPAPPVLPSPSPTSTALSWSPNRGD